MKPKDEPFFVSKEHPTSFGLVKESKQEPVALETIYETIIQWDEGGGKRSRRELARRIVSLYTTPPQRTWVGLTDEERKETLQSVNTGFVVDAGVVAQAIEAKLKEKNNG